MVDKNLLKLAIIEVRQLRHLHPSYIEGMAMYIKLRSPTSTHNEIEDAVNESLKICGFENNEEFIKNELS